MQRRGVNLPTILAGLLSLNVVMVTSWSWEESWFYRHRDPYHIDDYTHHPCKRECTADGQPKVCHYYFLLEHFTTMSAACHDCPDNQTDCTLAQCVTGDGFPRGILTANRRIPGPTVDVCEGDKIEVLIDNRMELGEGTSIHWHGVMQLGSPHMDGTSLVTQCPLHTWGKMVYRFTAKDVGTHFWHSHSSIQRSDGLFGGLIIRTPHSRDPQGPLYDHDLPEHNILLSDWSHQGAGEAYAQDFHSGKRAVIDSILVNGIGHYEDGPRLPYPEFQVKPGQRYRFRIAYNGIFNCPTYMKFDNHTMVVIASDGQNVEPLEVDALMIFSGERYDFVVQAQQDVKENFWIRFKGHGRCSGPQIFQAAILRYEGAEKVDPPGVANYRNTEEDENERILNGRSGLSTNTTFQVVDLKSLGPDHIVDKDILTGKPDKQFYISMGASKVVDERFELPPLPNHTTLEPPTVRPFNHQLNYISSRLPPSPPLSQYYDIPKDLMCNNDTVKEDCSQVFCLCVHMLNFELGDLVEIVLVSFSRTLIHPMHMHGHAFRVISQKSYNRDITVQEVKEMDKRGEIPRVTSQAPYKDTIGVHDQGVTILRFRAYNPGFWFFHCHIEFHSELGMALILQSGRPEDMPKAPTDFPTCGSWRPQHTTNKMEERNVTIHNTTNQKDSGSNPASAGMMEEGFLTSAMIISFSIVAVVTVAALSVYGYVKRKQGQKSVFYERLVNMDPQTYRSI